MKIEFLFENSIIIFIFKVIIEDCSTIYDILIISNAFEACLIKSF